MTGTVLSARALIVALLIGVIGTIAWFALSEVRSASGHAVQLASDPAPNEELTEAPETISINFSEPLEPSVTTVQLWDTTPEEIPVSEPTYQTEDSLTVDVMEELEPGIYTVIWRNLSTVDGHTWAGSFSFTVLEADGTVPEGAVPASLLDIAGTPSNTPELLDTVARWIVLIGSAVMLGGVAYVALVVLPATRSLSEDSRTTLNKLSTSLLAVSTIIAIFFVLQGSLIQLLIQADDLGGLDTIDNLLTETRFGKYLIARQGLLVVALISAIMVWRAKGALLPLGLVALGISSFGVLLTQSMVSHAAGSEGAFWKITTDLLHLTAASLWIGALIHIGLAMPRWLDELAGPARTLFAAESFRSFSILAAFSVLVLMISGVISAFAQFTSFSQLFETNYGLSLLGKMGIMIPLLLVAALNALWMQPRIVSARGELAGGATDEGGGGGSIAELQRQLAQSVRFEAVLGILVLVAVGVLIQLEPARAEAEAEAATGQAEITTADPLAAERGYFLRASQVGGLVISLKVDPGQVGENNFEVGLGSEFGSVGDVLLVRLDFDHPDPEIGQSRLELPLAGSAKFSTDATNLSLPGEWEVSATVQRRGEDDLTATFDVPVGVVQETESSIWDWPFEGMNSVGVIITLAVGAVLLVATIAWQWRNMRSPT